MTKLTIMLIVDLVGTHGRIRIAPMLTDIAE
jgi:hypothetical protein